MLRLCNVRMIERNLRKREKMNACTHSMLLNSDGRGREERDRLACKMRKRHEEDAETMECKNDRRKYKRRKRNECLYSLPVA